MPAIRKACPREACPRESGERGAGVHPQLGLDSRLRGNDLGQTISNEADKNADLALGSVGAEASDEADATTARAEPFELAQDAPVEARTSTDLSAHKSPTTVRVEEPSGAKASRNTPLRLVAGGPDHPLLKPLLDDLDRADRIDVAVAFVLRSGVDLVEPHLREALERRARVRFLTGDYMDATDPGTWK